MRKELTILDLINFLETVAPNKIAFGWDNTGLLIGEENTVVKRVLLTVDVTVKVVDYAIEKGFDTILSHHPLFLQPLRKINDPLYMKIIRNRINVYTMHTNLDLVSEGVSRALADRLELTEIKVIPNTGVDSLLNEEEYTGEQLGLGLIGNLAKEMELKDFAIFVKERLGANFVKLWPAASRVDLKVSRIGVCGGNGSSLIDVVSPYVDVFVSSDFTYHKILESRIPLIDAGHFHTEFPIMKTLQEKIEKLSIEVEVYDPKLAEINKLIII